MKSETTNLGNWTLFLACQTKFSTRAHALKGKANSSSRIVFIKSGNKTSFLYRDTEIIVGVSENICPLTSKY